MEGAPDITRGLEGLRERGPFASTPKPLRVIEAVARTSGLSLAELRRPNRKPGPALARSIAYYLLRTECRLTLARTGELMGGVDHSSVLAGVRRVTANLPGSQELRALVEQARTWALDPGEWPPCG